MSTDDPFEVIAGITLGGGDPEPTPSAFDALMAEKWGPGGDGRARLSLLCRVQQDRAHEPCSGTTDDGTERPCACACHAEGARWT